MPEESIQIRTGGPPHQAQTRHGARRNRWLIPLLCALVCTVTIAAVIITTRENSATRQSPASRAANRAAAQSQHRRENGDRQPPAAAPREQIVDDPRGELLWASPTAGPPISLAYVPAGTQCLIHFRPALINAHPEHERIFAALGPWWEAARIRLMTAGRRSVERSESMLIAFVIRADGQLDAAMRVESPNVQSFAEFTESIGDPFEVKEHAAQPYALIKGRGFFLLPPLPRPDGTELQIRISAPPELVPELIDSKGQSPPLVRDIESLAAHADADRAVTVIVSPKFLQAGGSELLADDAAPLREAVQQLVGSEATAVALSAHWDDNFVLELRAVPALNVPPRRLAALLRERIAAAPDEIEEFILSSPSHPYGRKVLARFPGMMRALARYTRSGEDNRQALARCYLPPSAGHNLVMASELLLTQPHAHDDDAATGQSQPLTLDEKLARKTSLVFSKDSLERALEMLAEDTGLDIAIQGADLQLDGITKNQTLALDLRDRPASEILVEILRRANPDRAAAGPGDPRQKLVYVVEPDQAGAPGRIIVTTRTAAEKRGLRLPDAFLLKKP
jgi:hypothetical protein